jgi:DNA-binding YbaB/EbfC family protein
VPPPQQPNVQALLKQAQKMQAQVLAAQESLVDARAEGSAGGGLVTATVTGTGELLSVSIKPEVIDPEDPETLADLVVAAVRDAQRAAHELAEDTMAPFNQGLPGLSL